MRIIAFDSSWLFLPSLRENRNNRGTFLTVFFLFSCRYIHSSNVHIIAAFCEDWSTTEKCQHKFFQLECIAVELLLMIEIFLGRCRPSRARRVLLKRVFSTPGEWHVLSLDSSWILLLFFSSPFLACLLSDSILGYDLLKKKADALTARFRKMLHEILDVFYEFFQRIH